MPFPQSGKGDTSKLTCYKCGKIRHIVTDTKCLLYKKPIQCQIFAVQVINDRSENDQPIANEPLEESEEIEDADPKLEYSDKHGEQSDLDSHTDDPDGSQYDEDSVSYEEYDGYVILPKDNNSDTEYICIMYEDEANTSTNTSPYLDNTDWKP